MLLITTDQVPSPKAFAILFAIHKLLWFEYDQITSIFVLLLFNFYFINLHWNHVFTIPWYISNMIQLKMNVLDVELSTVFFSGQLVWGIAPHCWWAWVGGWRMYLWTVGGHRSREDLFGQKLQSIRGNSEGGTWRQIFEEFISMSHLGMCRLL
jgi:hypothetical protein